MCHKLTIPHTDSVIWPLLLGLPALVWLFSRISSERMMPDKGTTKQFAQETRKAAAGARAVRPVAARKKNAEAAGMIYQLGGCLGQGAEQNEAQNGRCGLSYLGAP